MTDEVQNLAEAETVSGQVETAPLETEVAETPEVPEQPEKPARVFTQEELDAEIGKRLARAQRKWEREQAAKRETPQPVPKDLPPADQFESTEAYAEALALQKAEQLIADREARKQKAELVENYHDLEEKARDKYDDFEQVAYNPNLRITEVMAETIQSSEIGPDVAYYLGTNPKEAERIAHLAPFLQAKEIGKIESRLSDNPPVKKTTSAPAPITPVSSRNTGAPSYDTTDPRSAKTLSTSEWIEAERARQIRKLQAQNR